MRLICENINGTYEVYDSFIDPPVAYVPEAEFPEFRAQVEAEGYEIVLMDVDNDPKPTPAAIPNFSMIR